MKPWRRARQWSGRVSVSISDAFSRRRFLLASAGLAVRAPAAQQADPPRLRRQDSFLGFHFDLHPAKDDTMLGRDLTEDHIDRLLARTRPDYIQYDCKGHAGWLGYPSQVSPSSPGIVKDSLEMWRKVTARRGVALYIHFSGVWDSLAVATHPEWARVDAARKPSVYHASTFGPYVGSRMIPQLEEASQKYNLDGAWIDGECWATNPEYSAAVGKAFGEPLPNGPQDARWQEFLDFNRAQFRRYVRHYLDVLHKSRPNFQIASNWLYSSYVPEKPELPVDFLSGDYLGNASIGTARVEARYLASTGKPWDLMAWGFHSARSQDVGTVHKTPEQLMQEASVVLMQGGGFQVYFQPSRAGRFNDLMVETMGTVADFCHARREFCHKTETVPDAAVLFSGHSLYRTGNKLFGSWPQKLTAPVNGIVAAMSECHYLIDVLPDWKLEALSQYRFVVLPDWLNIGDHVAQRLIEYVKAGGRLLVAGVSNATLFLDAAGLIPTAAASDEMAWIAGPEMPGTIKGQWLSVDPGKAEVLATRHDTSDLSRDAQPAATLHRVGSGTVVVIPGPVGFSYDYTHSSAVREFLRGILRRLYEPALATDAPASVEFALRRKGPTTILHMANMTNMQVSAEYMTTDFIPKVGPFQVRLKLAAKPAKVTIEPGGKVLPGAWKDGSWTGQIDSLHIHSALLFT